MANLKLVFRTLGKTPSFTAVALLTVALGVGANTAIFSLVHNVLLRPLPFPEPERLLMLWELAPDDAGVRQRFRVAAANYFDWRAEARSFESMGVFSSYGASWTGDGEPEELLGARVSASYFDVLGMEPVLGRVFLPEENELGHHRVALLSHSLWQRRFGSGDVLGKTITLDGEPFEIVGVMPEAVYPTWPQATGRMPLLSLYQQVFVPMALSEERGQNRTSHVYGVVARLAPGASFEGARAEMDAIAGRLEAQYPENKDEGVMVTGYVEEVTGSARPALLVLWGAVGLVLFVACMNLSSLLLARSAGRAQEIAVRTALGAGRGALVRQFLLESFILAVGGGALGVASAYFGVDLLIRLSPAAVPRLADSRLNLPVLGFGFALSLLAGVLFGFLPAIQSARSDLTLRLKERGFRVGLRPILVTAELALSVVLVIGASLFLQSFARIERIDLGFDAKDLLVAEVNLPPSEYREMQQITAFHRELLSRLSATPGVRSSALAYDHPLSSNWIDDFAIEGEDARGESLAATLRIVSPAYFRTTGTELIQGRAFEELDDAVHPGAVIVNEAFARRYFDSSVVLGRRLLVTTPENLWGDVVPRVFEIVGVVENVRFLGPTVDPEPAFYLPAAQFPVQEMTVVVRTGGDPVSFAPRLREEVWSLDPSLPVSNVATMERLRSEALAQPRFIAIVLASFGATAIALAALGIYGLLATSVAQRTSEIGIRMAIGARAGDVVFLVIRQGARLIVVGLGIGLAAAFLTAPLLRSLLFEVGTADPWTFASAAMLLGAVAVFASYFPARRASRIEPLIALRRT